MKQAVPMRSLTDLTLPDSAATRAARLVVEQYAQPALLNHAHRSALWGLAYAELYDIPHDRELLWVAALLHDLGLEAPFDSHRLPFEEAGGHLAWVFGAAAGWEPTRCARVAEVIVRHMGDDLDPEEDPESFLLIRATSLDISGRRAEEWPAALRGEVLAAYPRLTLATDFARCFADQAERKPDSTAAEAMRSGIADRLRENPLERTETRS
jgi:hypothetical protein